MKKDIKILASVTGKDIVVTSNSRFDIIVQLKGGTGMSSDIVII